MTTEPVEVLPRLWRLPLRIANAYVVSTAGGLVLVDTGPPGSAGAICDAIRAIGFDLADIRAIVVTHHHADHAGSLAELLRQTGTEAWMHPDDAAEVRRGNGARDVALSSAILGLVPRVVRNLFLPDTTYEPALVAHTVGDSALLPGRIAAHHTPGHSAGHLALLWPEHGGVLFVGDACSNQPVLTVSAVYEDERLGRESLRRLAELTFDTAVFGHGAPIVGNAAEQFRRAFGDA